MHIVCGRMSPYPTSPIPRFLCCIQADLYSDASRHLAAAQSSFVVVFTASFTSVFSAFVVILLLPMVRVIARQLRRKRLLLLLMPLPLVASLTPLRLLVKKTLAEADAEDGIAGGRASSKRRRHSV